MLTIAKAAAHLNAILALSEIQIDRKNYEEATELLQTAIKIDPFHEDAYCRLMHVYAKTNRRREIIRHYQLLEQHLQEELGVNPLFSTQQLYKQLIQADSTSDS